MNYNPMSDRSTHLNWISCHDPLPFNLVDSHRGAVHAQDLLDLIYRHLVVFHS